MEITRYQDAAIDSRILRAVEEMGFVQMTPIQEQAIPVLLERKDVIGQAQTGTGKTAAFGIPVIQNTDPDNRNLQAVVLCPTRELAIQAADEMRRFAKYMHGVKILPIYGGQDINRQIKALKSGVQIIVGTPGRVMDHMRRHTLKMDQVNMVVLDEADEMLNMGFREDIETILQGIPSEHQTALFSATMPKPILEITDTYQQDATYLKMTRQELTIPLVKQYYYRVNSQIKVEVTSRLLDYYSIQRSLIFCNTKRMVDELSETLKGKGYAAEGLHGDLSQNQRDTVMNRFRSGNLQILIATDVAARGIDVDDVEAVFNYDLPQDIEYYVHRIGRTGRAGREGRSFTFVSNREMYRLRDIENSEYSAAELAAAFLKLQMGEEPQEIPEMVPERRRSYSRGSRDFSNGRQDRDGRNRSRGAGSSDGKRQRFSDDRGGERRRYRDTASGKDGRSGHNYSSGRRQAEGGARREKDRRIG